MGAQPRPGPRHAPTRCWFPQQRCQKCILGSREAGNPASPLECLAAAARFRRGSSLQRYMEGYRGPGNFPGRIQKQVGIIFQQAFFETLCRNRQTQNAIFAALIGDRPEPGIKTLPVCVFFYSRKDLVPKMHNPFSGGERKNTTERASTFPQTFPQLWKTNALQQHNSRPICCSLKI